jgi:adenylylsulfate kinase
MRDVKGLYRKVRSRLIAEFSGIYTPYEIPEHPNLVIQMGSSKLQGRLQQVVDKIIGNEILASTEWRQENTLNYERYSHSS